MIQYRKANIKDIDTIETLAIELCERESNEFDSKYNGGNPSTEKGRASIREALKSDDFLVVLAENSNGAIGFLIGGVTEPSFYWDFATLGELHKLYVQPEERGKRIGEHLMKDFMVFMEEREVDRIEICTFYDNNVNNFYKKFGFERKAMFLRKDY